PRRLAPRGVLSSGAAKSMPSPASAQIFKATDIQTGQRAPVKTCRLGHGWAPQTPTKAVPIKIRLYINALT
ncbi:MAG: hypothetical protein JZU58_11035, partial [Curvibacter lanceolatus]|uniref:hypothetical protein n=1 Tax=Curvibacter lanceolatus TaxID=86182 RepID=UPI002353E30E